MYLINIVGTAEEGEKHEKIALLYIQSEILFTQIVCRFIYFSPMTEK